jgi:hypothetical protein
MARKDNATWYRMMGSTAKLFIYVDLLVVGTITAIAAGGNPRSHGWIPPALIVAIGVYMLVGYYLGGIRAGPSGVTVGKLAGRRIHVPWADVERFEVVPVRGRNNTYYFGVVRKGEKPVLTAACCYEDTFTRKGKAKVEARAAQVIDALEAIRLRQSGRSASQIADPAQ